MEYSKPHLTYAEQLDLLRSRGLGCADPAAAVTLLEQIGYYRMSAYCYPMRQLLPSDHVRETSVQHRTSNFRPGYTFEDVADLYRFDKKLRMLLLDGIESFEVGVRVQIAHVLGKRDAFGHLAIEHLDEFRCGEIRGEETRHEEWINRFRKQVDKASSEDFVIHYKEKYSGELPVWVATEIMDFGVLVRLYGLMKKADRNEVARAFGLKTGRLFDGWLLSLSHLRNTCAHHSRLWNRRFTYRLQSIDVVEVGSDLHHVDVQTSNRKLYLYAAVLAYALRGLDRRTRWPANFRTLMRKFPEMDGIGPETDMGFPDGWQLQSLWRHP